LSVFRKDIFFFYYYKTIISVVVVASGSKAMINFYYFYKSIISVISAASGSKVVIIVVIRGAGKKKHGGGKEAEASYGRGLLQGGQR
jgi:hypothetical protein